MSAQNVGATEPRPPVITAICIIGFLGPLFLAPVLITGAANQVGSWYPLYLIIGSLVGVVCMAGMWVMKRWGAYSYAGFAVFNQVVMIAAGAWNPLGLLIPATIVYFSWKNLSKMS